VPQPPSEVEQVPTESEPSESNAEPEAKNLHPKRLRKPIVRFLPNLNKYNEPMTETED
jgi:hypothetical protein